MKPKSIRSGTVKRRSSSVTQLPPRRHQHSLDNLHATVPQALVRLRPSNSGRSSGMSLGPDCFRPYQPTYEEKQQVHCSSYHSFGIYFIAHSNPCLSHHSEYLVVLRRSNLLSYWNTNRISSS